MMYLDHSAIVAVLQKRSGWEDVARRIEDHQGKLIISPMSICAAVTAIAGASPAPHSISEATEIVTEFLKEASVQQITLSTAQTRAALEAQQAHLSKTRAEPLTVDEMLILGAAQTFRAGVLATGGRFADR